MPAIAPLVALVLIAGAATTPQSPSPATAGSSHQRALDDGSALEDRRLNREAAAAYRRAADGARAHGLFADEAYARARECRAVWNAGDSTEARRLCEKSLALSRLARSGRAEAEAEKILGILDQESGGYASAEARLRRALDIASRSGEEEIAISALNNLSAGALEQDRIHEALAFAQEASWRASSFPGLSVRMQFAVPYNLAKALEATGDDENARFWLDRATQSAEATKFGGGLHHVLMESAALLLKGGDAEGAGGYYERALAWNKAVPGLETDVALAREGLASSLEARGRSAEALELYRQALGVLRQPGEQAASVRTRTSVGRCLGSLGRPDEADRELGLAEALARRLGLRIAEEVARMERAVVRGKSARPGSARELEDAGHRLSAMGLPIYSARAYSGAAKVLETTGDSVGALRVNLMALDEIERARASLPAELQWRFLETAHDAYADAYRLRMGRVDDSGRGMRAAEAFAVIERERSRDLAGKARASRLQEDDSPDARLERIEAALLSEIPEAKRARLMQDRADAERDLLLRGGGGLSGWVDAPGALDAQRAALGSDEALLSYTLDEPAAVFIVSRSEIKALRLPPDAHLGDRAELFANLYAQGSAGQAQEVGRALSRALLAPTLQHLAPGIRRLLVATSGELGSVPFGALPLPASTGLLRDRYEVAYAPSLGVLAAVRASTHRTVGGGALVVADSTPGGSGSSIETRSGQTGPLPYARLEGREVASLFATRRLLEGANATPAATIAAAPGFGVLHFATHARVDPRAPMNSALLLSPEDSAGTGWMTARRIYAVPLHAALVTLSACRSSSGPRTRASDSLSLARAFLHAGARTVVAGLWDADDASTRELMRAFYEGLARDLTVGAALAEAQRVMAEKHDPSRWAGFVVVGDPETRVMGMRGGLAPEWGHSWVALVIGVALVISMALLSRTGRA